MKTQKKKKIMTPLQIIGLIQYKTNLTIPAYGLSRGYEKYLVYRAINGTGGERCDAVRDQIAQDVDKTKSELWPELDKGKE